MAEFSKIEWTDHTFNPWTGCTNVSPGCDHCYAEAWSKRSGHVKWGNNPRKRTTDQYWKAPAIWQAKAAEFSARNGRRQRVFCASLADVFDNQAEPQWRFDLFSLIKATPSLDWLLLTKRPQNVRKMLPADWGRGYSNVWLGFTAEDQARYDQRWKHLQAVQCVVRFVSYEPAIGPLRLCDSAIQPDWLIAGGESGHGARPMDPQWARDIIADCESKGVAPFFKQWGSYSNHPMVYEDGVAMDAVKACDPHGKGGGLLDGRIVRNFPSPRYESVIAA
ncbi:phage Gp37/Gp68 family protein [Mesorhizobium sp. CA16]|uniref:phage Gp37/Gp68 family protein n=1 Tax=Mesorhizobium sp. CA16 TaxID=588496 RepID=UPI001CC8FCBC|nr:phage Gp37/Gp68 family protein [Mesorhizobium sp. CA16]MBZ9913754.1 phage Gp37/Gp68 family protein [Mesorhizobium sp. CA16]